MKPRLDLFQNQGQKIYFLLEGDSSSPLITLLNGFARTHADFKIMTNKLVQNGFRVLTLDNRGSGLSRAEKSFTIEDMVDDIRKLWDFLNIERTFLLGISMGGMIARCLCLQDTRIKKVVFVSTCSTKNHISEHRVKFSTDFDQVHDQMLRYFHPAFISRNDLLVRSMVKQMVKQSADGSYLEQTNLQRLALERFDLDEFSKSKIDIETLVVHGKQDQIISIEGARELLDQTDGAKAIEYEECGHLILAEKPAQFYNDIISFFNH